MLEKLPDWAVKPPYNMIITGGAGSGKSSLLYSLLKSVYHKFYDVIYIFNKCRDSDDVWRGLEGEKRPVVEVYNDFDDEKLGVIIKEIEEVQDEQREMGKRPINVLMVFDDCLYSGVIKRGATNFNQLVINRRHWNISIIFTAQNYKGLDPSLRVNNVNALCVCGLNDREVKMIGEEHNGGLCSEEAMAGMYNSVKEADPFGFLVINYQKPREERFSMNFCKIMNPRDEATWVKKIIDDTDAEKS